MIKFGRSYYVQESEILVIESATSGRNDFPFAAKIILKNGTVLRIDFNTEKARDDEVIKISKSVPKNSDDNLDKLLDLVYQCRNILTTLDKRTLRIWRLINKLTHNHEETTTTKENKNKALLENEK